MTEFKKDAPPAVDAPDTTRTTPPIESGFGTFTSFLRRMR